MNVARLVVVLAFLAGAAPSCADDNYAAERGALMDEIAALARATADETGRPALDPRVMAVLGTVPRHRFVPAGEVRAAYATARCRSGTARRSRSRTSSR